MNAASIEKSKRLQRVDDLLATGKKYSTLEISQLAKVCAVNSCISELRDNGRNITCERKGDVWYYQMPERLTCQPPRVERDWRDREYYLPGRA
jgi:hypothetical protein